MVNTEKIFRFEQVEMSDLEVKGALEIAEDLPFFQGHFPGNPVLPAVTIVDASLELLRKKFPEKSAYDIQIKRSKFMKMVKPKHKVTLHAVHMGENLWKVVWQSQEEILAQVNLIL